MEDGEGLSSSFVRRTYRAAMSWLVARRGFRKAVAEDIVQDAFEVVLRRRGDVRGPLSRFFRGVIRQNARAYGRNEVRDRRRGAEGPAEGVPASGRSPSSQYALEQRLRRTLGTMAMLSADEQRLLAMRTVEGMSYRALAAKVGLATPVVAGRIFRAKAKVRRYVDGGPSKIGASPGTGLDTWLRQLCPIEANNSRPG